MSKASGDYLSDPNNPAFIDGNAVGCNTSNEVQQACISSSDPGVTNELQLLVFPNPTRGQIQITGLDSGKVRVLDKLGRVIKTVELSEAGINISDLPNGVYFLQISSGEHWTTQRIVKQ